MRDVIRKLECVGCETIFIKLHTLEFGSCNAITADCVNSTLTEAISGYRELRIIEEEQIFAIVLVRT